MKNFQNLGFSSKAVHVGNEPCPETGALVAPIYQTSTYTYANTEEAGKIFSGEKFGYLYGRDHSPTEYQVEEKIAALEGGEACKTFASGMAAISSIAFALLESGDHVICGDVVYGGTYGLFQKVMSKYNIGVTYVDTSKLGNIEAAIQGNTKYVHIETPANPTLKLTDIRKTADLCKDYGIKLVVDNTFMTPYYQRPLEYGADLVVHSATKYMGGHGDLIAGAVIGSKDFIKKELHQPVTKIGGLISPFTAFLLKRGLQTLPLRMEKHSSNALKVARFLDSRPEFESVIYPGLESHPHHELAKEQMGGSFGGLISVEVKGGLEAGQKLVNNLEMLSLAVSLGDVGSLVQHPASMTHKSLPLKERRESGITDGLIRFSIGIEDPEDIIADIEQALDKLKL